MSNNSLIAILEALKKTGDFKGELEHPKSFEESILTGGYPTLVLTKKPEFIEEKIKDSKGFKPGTIYVDENTFSSTSLVLSARGYNRNMRYYNSKLFEISIKQYQNKIMSTLYKSLILNDMRSFYSYLCRARFIEGKTMYIVRKIENSTVPYILTDDIRIIMYSYIPYKFKKEDLEVKDNHYNDGAVKVFWKENSSWSWLPTGYQNRASISQNCGSVYLNGGFDTFIGNQKYRRGES